MESNSAHYHREDSFLHSRYIYTHSDCSSSLSSLSVSLRNTDNLTNTASHGWHQRSSKRKLRIATVAAALVVIATSAGLCSIYGIFNKEYEDIYGQLGATNQQTRIIGLVGGIQIAGLIIGRKIFKPISLRVGPTASIVVGATACSGGLLAAGYASWIWQLCLAQGVLVGVGASICAGSAAEVAEEVAGGSMAARLMLIGSGVGGGALSLGASGLVSAGSTGSALRWLALTVLASQLAAAAVLGVGAWVGRQELKRSGSERSAKDVPVVTTSSITAAEALMPNHYGNSLKWRPRTLGVRMRAMVRRAREARWIGVALMVNTLHSLAVMVPVVYVPSYAAQQFGDSPQAGAWLLSLMCFASCVGAAARPGSRWARVGLSAAVWCVWLPAGDSWAMACVFCGVYGAFMGATAATPAAGGGWADAAAALGGLTGAGWLMAGGAADVARYVPVATFAAAGSLLAAIAAVAGPCTSSTWFLRASQ